MFAFQLPDLFYKPLPDTAKRVSVTRGVRRFGEFAPGVVSTVKCHHNVILNLFQDLHIFRRLREILNQVQDAMTQYHRLTVDTTLAMLSVEVFNLFGQLVCRASAGGAEVRIENLPKGILILKVTLQGGGFEIRKAAN